LVELYPAVTASSRPEQRSGQTKHTKRIEKGSGGTDSTGTARNVDGPGRYQFDDGILTVVCIGMAVTGGYIAVVHTCDSLS
jgi:hypothetical protein